MKPYKWNHVKIGSSVGTELVVDKWIYGDQVFVVLRSPERTFRVVELFDV